MLRAIVAGTGLMLSGVVIVTTLYAVLALLAPLDVTTVDAWWCVLAALLLTGIYVSKANSKYDPLIRKIVGGNRS